MRFVLQPNSLFRSKILALKVTGFPAIFVITIYLGSAHASCFRLKQNLPPFAGVTNTFVSAKGRFSIALPNRANGSGQGSADTLLGRANGHEYFWRIKEGDFFVNYFDAGQSWDDPATRENMMASIHDSVGLLAHSEKGKVVSERKFSFENHPGFEFKLEFPDSTRYQRYYLISRRYYQVFITLRKEQRDYEAFALKVFESFKLLSDAEVSAAAKAKAAEDEPAALPQEPFVSRVRSDSEAQNLKGKVNTVFDENQALSETGSAQTRTLASRTYYNERGYLTRSEFFEAEGYLSEITVYGYLDGFRVKNSKAVYDEDDPTPRGSVAPLVERKSDQRYSFKLTYRYDDNKRLIEEDRFKNDGQLWTRIVDKYSGNPVNQHEKLIYGGGGSLNWHSLSTLDDNGNELEQTQFEVRDGSVRSKHSYKYEFDEKGNWIKRTSSKWVTKDGKSEWVEINIDFRTITYY